MEKEEITTNASKAAAKKTLLVNNDELLSPSKTFYRNNRKTKCS